MSRKPPCALPHNHATCITGFLRIFDQQPTISSRKHHHHCHHHRQSGLSTGPHSSDSSSCLTDSSYESLDMEKAIRPILMKQQEQIWCDERDKHRHTASTEHNLNVGKAILRESMQNKLLESPHYLMENFGYSLSSFDSPQSSADGLDKPYRFTELNYKDFPPRHSLDGRENCALTLEEMRESIRKLAKLQEDGYEAPMSSPILRMNGSVSPFSYNTLDYHRVVKEPPRSSSFDYKEAIRFRQKLDKEEPRLSLDSRTIPKCVIEIRQALQAHLDESEVPSSYTACSSPDMKLASRSNEFAVSITRSTSNKEAAPKNSHRRLPSVIARLMGLENLPDVIPLGKPKSVKKKPSKEGKHLQELLQCKRLENPVQLQEPVRLGRVRSNQDQAPQMYTLSSVVSESRESLQANAKGQRLSVDPVELSGKQMQKSASVTKLQQKMIEPVSASLLTKPEIPQNQDQMKEILERNAKNDDEIESRLRQLGLQSSEHERKTLKQILEAMHLKGLFQVSPIKQPQNLKAELNFRPSHSDLESPNLNIDSQMVKCSKRYDSPARSHKSNTLIAKAQSKSLVEGKTEASIVIIKPFSKSLTTTIGPLSTTKNDTIEGMRALKKSTIKSEISCINERSHSSDKLKTPASSRTVLARQQQPMDKQCSVFPLKPTRDAFINGMVQRSNQAMAKHKEEIRRKPPLSDSQLRSRTRKTATSQKPSIREENAALASSNQISVNRERRIASPRKHPIREENAVLAPSNRNSVAPPARKDGEKFGNLRHRPPKLLDRKLTKTVNCSQFRDEAINGNVGLSTVPRLYSDNVTRKAFNNMSDEPQEHKTRIQVKVHGNIDSQDDVQSSPVSVLDATHSDISERSPDYTGDSHPAKNGLRPSDEYLSRVSFLRKCSNFTRQPPFAEFTADFKYVHEIMLSASIDAMTRRWYLHGNPMDVNALYITLEMQREEEDPKLAMLDRDHGGQLYMKSRQEAMRRRMLLECMNEILSRKLWRNVFEWDRRKGQRGMVEEIWGDIERLMMMGGSIAEKVGQDDICRILEKDLGVEGHYGDDGQAVNIADEVSKIMLLDLVGELVSEFP